MNASRATTVPHNKAAEEEEAGDEEQKAIKAGSLSRKVKPELMGLVHFPLA